MEASSNFENFKRVSYNIYVVLNFSTQYKNESAMGGLCSVEMAKSTLSSVECSSDNTIELQAQASSNNR
jgi:hypothetical protein